MYDALILGDGPAGLATAIMLAQLGHRVLLLGRVEVGQMADKIGESLSPAANAILQQLGVWENFCAGDHRPCFGNKSSWGGPQLDYYDFINDPNGHAWHLNRRLFERQLSERATALGVQHIIATVTQAYLVTVQTANPDWQLRLAVGQTEQSVAASFVVDASGRASWFARRQGAQQQYEDRQVALIAFLQPSGALLNDSTSLIEAVADGWWYSALLPDQRLATSFMTDPDLHNRHVVVSPHGWHALLDQTRYTAQRVREHGYVLAAKPRFVSADSGRLDCLGGEQWLAVGDAALRYDPLSAHGLTLALAGGRDAALAISAQLAGDNAALATYATRLTLAYDQYSTLRQAFYRAETRWSAAPYWQRRNGLAQ